MLGTLEAVLANDLESPMMNAILTMPPPTPIPIDTLVIDTDSMTQPAISQPRPRSPLTIFTLGIGIIALLAVIALLSRTPPAPAAEGVPSMTSDTGTYTHFEFEPGDSANAFWPIGQTGSVTREITEDGFYRFGNQRTGIATTSILEGANYQDSVITIEGRLETESAAASAFGIVFHYVDVENYYVFAVDGSQRYSIWVREQGNWRELRAANESWTFSESIAPLGSQNELRVMIHGDHLIGSINGETVADVFDTTLTEGQVGLYLATPSSGPASSLIDSYLIEVGTGDAPSMTADQ
jgi:hypothetical protein